MIIFVRVMVGRMREREWGILPFLRVYHDMVDIGYPHGVW